MSTKAITSEIKLDKKSKKEFIEAMKSKSSSVDLGKETKVTVK